MNECVNSYATIKYSAFINANIKSMSSDFISMVLSKKKKLLLVTGSDEYFRFSWTVFAVPQDQKISSAPVTSEWFL